MTQRTTRRARYPDLTAWEPIVFGPIAALAMVGVLAIVVLFVAVATDLARGLASDPVLTRTDDPTGTTDAAGPGAGADDDPSAVARPLRATALRIPALAVDSELVPLDLTSDGVLPLPSRPDIAGWFAGGPVPGELGRVVLAGHVDSTEGPGVFADLATLSVGATVDVGRSDGAVVQYRVVSVASADTEAFPTEDVYGPAPLPELRLLTYGGAFDRSAGRYLDNVVVSAVQLSSSARDQRPQLSGTPAPTR